MHLLHTVLHTFLMVLLMTCLCKQQVLLLGEIGWGSLLGLKVIIEEFWFYQLV